MKHRDELHHKRGDARRREGTVIMLVVVGMLGMMAMGALATDVGHVWAARTELQGAVDSAALAGAGDLFDQASQSVTCANATTTAMNLASSNQADQKTVSVPGSDIVIGDWNPATRTFTPQNCGTAPADLINAVQVDGELSDAKNGAVQTVLANLVGRDRFEIGANAVGYLGFVGDFPSGTVDLPIAVDCCPISGGSSCGDYCAYLANPNNKPNPFTLPTDHTVEPTAGCADMTATSCVTKLELESTPEQNICYTDFQGDSNVTVPDLLDIIRNSNPDGFGVDDGGVNLDNGDKTPVIRLIKEKFLGIAEFFPNPAGQPLYGTTPHPDNPFGIDSWVVAMPVVECQTGGDHCAGGSAAAVEGGVCFEVRRVDAPNYEANKEIYGRFFCPGPGELDCGVEGSGPGGKPGSLRAERPVLVQ